MNLDTSYTSTEKVCKIISEALLRNDSRVLICGDFNYPEIDWNNDYLNKEAIQLFIATLQEHHLYQHVCKPTRYHDDEEPSLLDLILTTEEGMVENLEHSPALGESDHECLFFTLNCYRDTPITR